MKLPQYSKKFEVNYENYTLNGMAAPQSPLVRIAAVSEISIMLEASTHDRTRTTSPFIVWYYLAYQNDSVTF
jgi:hypothetical protein